jgi:hypothetical protein
VFPGQDLILAVVVLAFPGFDFSVAPHCLLRCLLITLIFAVALVLGAVVALVLVGAVVALVREWRTRCCKFSIAPLQRLLKPAASISCHAMLPTQGPRAKHIDELADYRDVGAVCHVAVADVVW